MDTGGILVKHVASEEPLDRVSSMSKQPLFLPTYLSTCLPVNRLTVVFFFNVFTFVWSSTCPEL